ncbi:MAG: sigma-54-dependent Fis family transcriptional regulator [Bacteroidetes bacterium]|nr:MAG: sigma-54-dependent Fis family transcriptional regulator [Bacteroidota bacterium]REK06461.1 MAG: sigma-54-dependent Fis family transcriptional regulator [Bacteroidota bacterium]REK33227.1 MAG: sigma-54-dependent Fis family transcriptional regulator [Bacteroidota bacterium]REK47064.1 MAG: sigma-54-dependent Fis family transcriptional regulator [Bacteroidota bacterium]
MNTKNKAKSGKILIIDDDPDICTLLESFLQRSGFEIFTALSGKAAIKILGNTKPDLILCDFRLGDYDGLDMLQEIRNINSEIPVIIITGYSDIRTAVKVIKTGAFDYISKPLIPDEILHIIGKALHKETDADIKMPSEKSTSKQQDNYIIGFCKQAQEIEKQIKLVAPTNMSVIIYGESGSGKEAVANRIHNLSDRNTKPFVALDCGAISRELAGSELYGHEKGAFTGALQAKTGLIELANGGTLFLDEVANLSYEVQVSLLRAVQERKIRKLGSNIEIPVDVRILVASNEDLTTAYHQGKFREDLFHRFNEFSFYLPPLRERGDDIMIFTRHFLNEANIELKKEIKEIDADYIECLKKYAWPGNIRELKNVIKRSVLLTDGNILLSKTLPNEISNAEKFNFSNFSVNSKSVKNLYLKDAAQEAEYELIIKTLKMTKNNKSEAARILNIDRKTLYNKLNQFDIQDEQIEGFN